MKIIVRGRPNYWRYTVYNWLLEVIDVLSREFGELIEVVVEDGDSEDPEIYINDCFIGSGVPGEEGYLIELIKSGIYRYCQQRE